MVQWLCFFKHDLKLTQKEARQQPQVATISGTAPNDSGVTSGPRNTEADPEDDDDTAPGFCCWKGCITGTLAVFMFFIVFPAGILMINYSHNKKDTEVLIAGILLTVLPLFALGLIIFVLFHRRKAIKRQRQKYSQTPSLS